MILTGAIILLLAALYAAAAAWLMFRLGLSRQQAILYLPLKLLFRTGDRGMRDARAAPTPVIYVVTHQSGFDPALMLSLLPEETLHILDPESASAWWLEPYRSLARTITFNAEHVFVSRRLVRVLKGNGRLCVYIPAAVEPDTRSFRLYRAVSRIAMQAEARIVPIFVSGSSALYPGTAARRRLLPRLDISVLPPLTIPAMIALGGNPAASASNALFDRVAESRMVAGAGNKSLFQALTAAAQRVGPSHEVVEDVTGVSMDYRRLLTAARIFGEHFARTTAPGEAVGVMLPNSNGAAISLLGLASSGRAAAMLNYSAGEANIASAIGTAMIRTVVSSRVFVAKASLSDLIQAIGAAGAKLIWLEDLRDGITGFDKAAAALLWRRPVAAQKTDAPAVIMFTSGSEGTPKAVVLSGANVVANALQVEARVAVTPRDRLMNVLPVFHAFGLTGGLVLPLLSGVKVLLYPSPLQYRAIPEAAAKFKPTVLVGTDTFLTAYAKTASDTDFASLRFVVAGAEAVRASTRRVWQERFGVRLLEGFGLTEAAPVVAVNSLTQARDGTVGRLMPGMRMRIEPVEGVAEGGRLWLSGPNIMLGTMSAEQPGVLRPVPNGWHDSGDIVSVDREGFLTIRGRAKRFAKIAGEMISLAAVELLAQGLWPDDRHIAVSLPDVRKGERIILLSTTSGADTAALRRFGKEAGASDLMLPHEIMMIDEIPLLASGKTDYAAAKRIALERSGPAAAA